MQVVQHSWSQRRLEFALLFDALEKFESEAAAQGIRVVRIKGSSLVPRFYPDPGDRHLCDVDVLIQPSDLQRVEGILQKQGFTYHPVIPWSASKFRKAWFKAEPNRLPVSIDVHTSLYWDQPARFSPTIVSDPLGFLRLADEHELLHLIINWIEQDSCVESTKLRDILLYINETKIDWEQWVRDPVIRRHWRSLQIAQLALVRMYDFHWPIELPQRNPLRDYCLQRMVTKKFLKNPKGSLLRFVLFRFYTRPLWKALSYHIQWLWAYGPSLARQFLFRRLQTDFE